MMNADCVQQQEVMTTEHTSKRCSICPLQIGEPFLGDCSKHKCKVPILLLDSQSLDASLSDHLWTTIINRGGGEADMNRGVSQGGQHYM